MKIEGHENAMNLWLEFGYLRSDYFEMSGMPTAQSIMEDEQKTNGRPAVRKSRSQEGKRSERQALLRKLRNKSVLDALLYFFLMA